MNVRSSLFLLLTAATRLTLAQDTPQTWRAEHRTIDLHMHIDPTEEHFARAVKIMDAAGIGIGVNLSGGTVTHAPGEKSEFEKAKEMADRLYPGRFVHYMNLDYAGWNDPDFGERAAGQIEEGKRLGAAGFKEYKRLGLYLRDREKSSSRSTTRSSMRCGANAANWGCLCPFMSPIRVRSGYRTTRRTSGGSS
jgi:hypothetical protein